MGLKLTTGNNRRSMTITTEKPLDQLKLIDKVTFHTNLVQQMLLKCHTNHVLRTPRRNLQQRNKIGTLVLLQVKHKRTLKIELRPKLLVRFSEITLNSVLYTLVTLLSNSWNVKQNVNS